MARRFTLTIILITLLIFVGFYFFFHFKKQEFKQEHIDELSHLSVREGMTYDVTGRDLVYVKSTIENKIDYNSKSGWLNDRDGRERHFVGKLVEFYWEKNKYFFTLKEENNNNLERFYVNIDSNSYLNVLNLSDYELKSYNMGFFHSFSPEELNTIFQKGDILHVFVNTNVLNEKITTTEKSEIFHEAIYLELRRIKGINQVRNEIE